MRHKHVELIKAWADGAKIEYLTTSKIWFGPIPEDKL